jgi:hypothetical protein
MPSLACFTRLRRKARVHSDTAIGRASKAEPALLSIYDVTLIKKL